MTDRAEPLQGSLDLLILKTLRLGPLHGWGISKLIRQLPDDALQVNQGSLYPAVYRLEERGWIAAEWEVSPEGRRVKVYSLTPDGRKRFAPERASWTNLARAVDRLLEAT